MVLIDTNVIIRFIIKEPKEQFEVAKELFEEVAKEKLKVGIDECVVLESYYVLHKVYGIEKDEVLDILQKILLLKNVVHERKFLLLEALQIMKKRRIDFVDALLCAKSKLFGISVVSFDKDLEKCKDEDGI